MALNNIILFIFIGIISIHVLCGEINNNDELLNALMPQAKTFIAYREGNQEEKLQAQRDIVLIIKDMIYDFENAYLNERLKATDYYVFENKNAYIQIMRMRRVYNPYIENDLSLYFALLIRFIELEKYPQLVTLQDIEKFGYVLTLLSLDDKDGRTYTTKPFGHFAVNSFPQFIHTHVFFNQDIRAFFHAYRPKMNWGEFVGGHMERQAYYSMDLTSAKNGGRPLEIAPFYSKTGIIGVKTMNYALAHGLLSVGFFLTPPQDAHTGVYANFPLGSLFHDYRHVFLLVRSMNNDVIYKNNIFKEIYYRIDRQEPIMQRNDMIFLFILTHELTFSRSHPFVVDGKKHSIGQGFGFKSYIKANPHMLFQSIPMGPDGRKIAAQEFIESQHVHKSTYLLDLEDIALLLDEIEPVFIKEIQLGDDSTWEDFRQFKRFVRARLFECFNDFKLRHSEYRKKTHGYSIKSLEHNLREDYFRFENDLSIAVNLFKKAVMRYQEAAPAQKLHFQQKLEKAERKLSEIQHHFISLKMRLSENN